MSADRLPIASARVVRRELRGPGASRITALVAVLIAAALAGIVGPVSVGAVVDVLAAPQSSRTPAIEPVLTLGAAMAVAAIGGSILSAVGVVFASDLCERMLADLRERMVGAALRLPAAHIERAGTADVVARAGDDVAEVSDAIPRLVPALAGALFTIAVTLVGVAAIDLRYAAVLLVVIPVHVFAVRRYLREAPEVYAAERAAMADRAHQLLDALRGIETVRAYRLAEHRVHTIAGASWEVVRWTMRARAIQNVFFARLNIAEYLGMVGILGVGLLLVSSGAGTAGATTAAVLLFLRLFGPINQLLFVMDDLQSALASLGRIVGVIHANDAAGPVSSNGARSSTPVTGTGLALHRVGYAYSPGNDVLHDVSIVVAPGETLAVVGSSGAGKTTLAAIAAGVTCPSHGSVTRPSRVVLVTQDVHVFDATLRENLTLAAPSADDARLIWCLERVGADRLLTRLSRGLDEAVGASGWPLTAAEAQQVALARVLVAEPDLVVLDEATAEADSIEAGRLEAAADAATSGRTALVVAHRLSQAETADRVVVMGAGRILEEGTHAQLVAAGGAYARLWKAWGAQR